MKKVYESREISREAKVTVFEAVAIPTLMCGCEVWVLTEKEKSRLQATEMRMLRKIAGVSRLDRVRNETVRERLRLKSGTEEGGEEERMLEGKCGEQKGKCGGESPGRRRSGKET